jgi:ketol-acid reductoisomerase
MAHKINEDGLKRSTLASYIIKATKTTQTKKRKEGINRAIDRISDKQRWYVNSDEKKTVKEESMDPITEAIKSIREGKLDEMRNHFNKALAQKAVEKLEEKKLEMASAYFGQK